MIFGLAFLSDWGQVTITRDFNFLIGIAFSIAGLLLTFAYRSVNKKVNTILAAQK